MMLADHKWHHLVADLILKAMKARQAKKAIINVRKVLKEHVNIVN